MNKKINNNKQGKFSYFINTIILILLLFISLTTFPLKSSNKYSEKNIDNFFPELENIDTVINISSSSPSVISKINTENKSIDEIHDDIIIEKEITPYVYLGSFAYTSANFNTDKSDFYFDNLTRGISFIPDYEIQEINENNLTTLAVSFLSNLTCNNFLTDNYVERRCINENCLSILNNNLYYNDKLVNLPLDINNVEAISIAILDNQWIVGFTVHEENKYKALVYYFNGHSFTILKNLPEINSQYFGRLGFGGFSNDFLIIYGGTQGIAYRIKGDNIIDISEYFDFRIMKKGFKAEVVGLNYNDNKNFYIYSSTCNNPVFLKLWTNDKNEIIGEISLLDSLALSGEEFYIYLNKYDSNVRNFNIYLQGIHGEKYYNFYDYGFEQNNKSSLYSNKMFFSNSQDINLKQIFRNNIKLNNEDNSFDYRISIDDNNWEEVNLNQDGIDVKNNISYYVLKLVLFGPFEKFYSPYITGIFFDYGYTKF